MKNPEQERIEELETLVEYWRLELCTASNYARIEAAEKQVKAFSAELKSLTARQINANIMNDWDDFK
jgi:hypothetical protein